MSARKRPVPKPKRPRAAPALRLHASFGSQPWLDPVSVYGAWAVCVGFAIVAAWFILGPHRLGDYLTETDFYGAYAQGARLIQQGHLDPSRYGVIGPVYEVALGLLGFVIRDLFFAAELLSFAASLAVLLLWFELLRRRVNAVAGMFTILFIAANAHFLHFAYSAATDMFAIALQAATLFALLGATRTATSAPSPDAAAPSHAEPGTRHFVVGGVCGALAFLTRYNAIYVVPAGLAAIAFGATGTAYRARASLAFLGGFLVLVVPWIAYSLGRGGAFSFQLHHNIAYEVFARAHGIAWDDYQKMMQPQFHSLWDVIARDPGAVFSRMAFNGYDHLRLDLRDLLGMPVAIAALAGATFAQRAGVLGKLWPVWLSSGLLFLTLVPVFHSERYSLALLPMYASLAGFAFAMPFAALTWGAGRIWLKPLLALIPLVSAIQASIKVQARMIDQLPTEVLTAAETLKRLRHDGDRVISRKSHIAYHGGVEPLAFPFADSIPQLARYAHEHHARWIYFSWPEAETRPSLRFLLDTSATVPGLVPRPVTKPHPAVLYEVGPEFGAQPAWIRNDTLVLYHNLRAELTFNEVNPRSLYVFAAVAQTLGKLGEARHALERLLRRAPDDTEALIRLGDVLLALNEPEHALRVLDRLRAIDPTGAPGALGRGMAQLLLGRDQEAASTWRPVIEATRHRGTLERMILVYARLGDGAAEARARAQIARVFGSR